MTEWISVDDALPGRERVLILVDDGKVVEFGNFCFPHAETPYCVNTYTQIKESPSHWMPLPKPPRSEDD